MCPEASSSDQCPVALKCALLYIFWAELLRRGSTLGRDTCVSAEASCPSPKKNLHKAVLHQRADSALCSKLQYNSLPFPYIWPTHAASNPSNVSAVIQLLQKGLHAALQSQLRFPTGEVTSLTDQVCSYLAGWAGWAIPSTEPELK